MTDDEIRALAREIYVATLGSEWQLGDHLRSLARACVRAAQWYARGEEQVMHPPDDGGGGDVEDEAAAEVER